MKKVLIIAGVSIIVLVVGFILLNNYIYNQKQAQDIENAPVWEERTNQEQGFSYQYPDSLGTEYIEAQGWPPSVSVTTAQFLCAEPLRDIDGREYCVGEDTEGAAGSIYTTHTYNTLQDGRMITVSFTLRYPQCGNYSEPQREECEQEQNTFNVGALVNQIVDSVEIRR